jgi:hypothetical protein
MGTAVQGSGAEVAHYECGAWSSTGRERDTRLHAATVTWRSENERYVTLRAACGAMTTGYCKVFAPRSGYACGRCRRLLFEGRITVDLPADDLARIVALTGCAWDGNCTYSCPHCDGDPALVEAAIGFASSYHDQAAIVAARTACAAAAMTEFEEWTREGLSPTLAELVTAAGRRA